MIEIKQGRTFHSKLRELFSSESSIHLDAKIDSIYLPQLENWSESIKIHKLFCVKNQDFFKAYAKRFRFK